MEAGLANHGIVAGVACGWSVNLEAVAYEGPVRFVMAMTALVRMLELEKLRT